MAAVAPMSMTSPLAAPAVLSISVNLIALKGSSTWSAAATTAPQICWASLFFGSIIASANAAVSSRELVAFA